MLTLLRVHAANKLRSWSSFSTPAGLPRQLKFAAFLCRLRLRVLDNVFMPGIRWSIHLSVQVLIPDPSERSAHDDGSFAFFCTIQVFPWPFSPLARPFDFATPATVSIQAPTVTCKTHLYKPPDQVCGCAGTVAVRCNLQMYSHVAMVSIHLQSQSLTIQTPFWSILIHFDIFWIDSREILRSPSFPFANFGTAPILQAALCGWPLVLLFLKHLPLWVAASSHHLGPLFWKRRWVQTNRIYWLIQENSWNCWTKR